MSIPERPSEPNRVQALRQVDRQVRSLPSCFGAAAFAKLGIICRSGILQVQLLEVQAAELRALRATRVRADLSTLLQILARRPLTICAHLLAIYQDKCGILFTAVIAEVQRQTAGEADYAACCLKQFC